MKDFNIAISIVGSILVAYNSDVVFNNSQWLVSNEYDFKNKYKSDQWRFWLYPEYTFIITLLTFIPTGLVLKRLFTKGTNP